MSDNHLNIGAMFSITVAYHFLILTLPSIFCVEGLISQKNEENESCRGLKFEIDRAYVM